MILLNLNNKRLFYLGITEKLFLIQNITSIFKKYYVAERSFDLRTSGLWAQHASTAPLCFMKYLILFGSETLRCLKKMMQ